MKNVIESAKVHNYCVTELLDSLTWVGTKLVRKETEK